MIKNLGLNITLIENQSRSGVISKGNQLNWHNLAKQAKRDFAEQGEIERLRFPKIMALYLCETYLCNWEGLGKDLTEGRCPACGRKVRKKKLSDFS
jgi:hypothetical protein